MSRDPTGGPAFPRLTHAREIPETGGEASAFDGPSGMTLRDWLAGQALNGLLASPTYSSLLRAGDCPPGVIAGLAVEVAEAALAALDAGTPGGDARAVREALEHVVRVLDEHGWGLLMAHEDRVRNALARGRGEVSDAETAERG